MHSNLHAVLHPIANTDHVTIVHIDAIPVCVLFPHLKCHSNSNVDPNCDPIHDLNANLDSHLNHNCNSHMDRNCFVQSDCLPDPILELKPNLISICKQQHVPLAIPDTLPIVIPIAIPVALAIAIGVALANCIPVAILIYISNALSISLPIPVPIPIGQLLCLFLLHRIRNAIANSICNVNSIRDSHAITIIHPNADPNPISLCNPSPNPKPYYNVHCQPYSKPIPVPVCNPNTDTFPLLHPLANAYVFFIAIPISNSVFIPVDHSIFDSNTIPVANRIPHPILHSFVVLIPIAYPERNAITLYILLAHPYTNRQPVFNAHLDANRNADNAFDVVINSNSKPDPDPIWINHPNRSSLSNQFRVSIPIPIPVCISICIPISVRNYFQHLLSIFVGVSISHSDLNLDPFPQSIQQRYIIPNPDHIPNSIINHKLLFVPFQECNTVCNADGISNLHCVLIPIPIPVPISNSVSDVHPVPDRNRYPIRICICVPILNCFSIPLPVTLSFINAHTYLNHDVILDLISNRIHHSNCNYVSDNISIANTINVQQPNTINVATCHTVQHINADFDVQLHLDTKHFSNIDPKSHYEQNPNTFSLFIADTYHIHPAHDLLHNISLSVSKRLPHLVLVGISIAHRIPFHNSNTNTYLACYTDTK